MKIKTLRDKIIDIVAVIVIFVWPTSWFYIPVVVKTRDPIQSIKILLKGGPALGVIFDENSAIMWATLIASTAIVILSGFVFEFFRSEGYKKDRKPSSGTWRSGAGH